MEFTSDGTPAWAKVMQINSGGNVVIFNALKMLKGSGAFNLEVLTGVQLWLPILADIPVLTPTAFLPGMWAFKIMVTKGRQFFVGEPGANTQMYFSNSTGSIGWKLDSDDSQARFVLQPFTGWATAGLMWYTQWNVNGTIQAGNTNIITAINAWPAETYVTKWRANSQWYVTGTFVTLWTNQTITGDKVFTGSTELRWGLLARLDWMWSSNTGWSMDENGIEYVGYSCSDFGANSLMNKSCISALVTGYNSNLSNTYVPYRSGDRFYDSNTVYNPVTNRLQLWGWSWTLSYSWVAIISSGGAYFDWDNLLWGFSIPIWSWAWLFWRASGTGRYAWYLQTNSNAFWLGIDAYASSTAWIFTSQFGQLLDLTTTQWTGISITKLWWWPNLYPALTINNGNMAVDYSGNISTVGNQTFINPTIAGQDFRFARSGGLMEWQYFTGGVRVSAMVYTMP